MPRRPALAAHRRALAVQRDPIKGVAILWVCFFHARLGLENIPFIGALQQVGYLGVDIFTLLSGYGLWHSLERSPSSAAYLKRRAIRLLPAFLPVALLWCLCMVPALCTNVGETLHTVLGTLTMTGYLTGAPYSLNWYLSLLLVTILLAVPVHALVKKSPLPHRCLAGMLAAAVLLGTAFFGKNQLMLVSRLPIFLLGMGLALPKPQQARHGTAALVCLGGFAAGALLLWLGFAHRPDWLIRYGLYWYPGLLMVPGLCGALGFVMDKLTAFGFRLQMLTTMGKASFEIFLFNCWFELYLKRVVNTSEPVAYVMGALLSIVLGLLWHMLLGLIISKRKTTQYIKEKAEKQEQRRSKRHADPKTDKK